MLAAAHFYQALRVSANPIKRGGQIATYLQDCQEIHSRITDAMRRAIYRHWEAPFPVVMAAAVDDLARRLDFQRDPATGLPVSAIRNLSSYYSDIVKTL